MINPRRKSILILVLLAFALQAPARRSDGVSLRSPLDIPLQLAGNFGELRRNHFHSGIDFKTQGRTGFPVHAVDDGYVSRASVSPWGFGRAVYVTHPSTGLTTVYGHLEAFSPEIDKLVRDRQYELETFTIDVEFEPGQLPVKRGDVIARSGNAGSSGGPHVHFDVRDTQSGDPLDPLEYYRTRIQDNVPPEVRKIALYPADGGIVDGSTDKGVYRRPAEAASFEAWGDVVPGILAYDRMTATSNIYGVKYLTLLQEGDTVYNRVIDRFSFDDTKAIHTIINNADLENKSEWIMTTRVAQSNPLPYMVKAKNKGIVTIDSARTYKFEWILEDEHGNRTRKPFQIVGKKQPVPGALAHGQLMLYDADNATEVAGMYLEVPAGALYDNTFVDVSSSPSANYLSNIFSIGSPEVPLGKTIDVFIPLTADTLANKRQYCLVRLSGNGRSAVEATYAGAGMQARLSRFGRYAVASDSTAPTITPINKAKWRATGTVKFKITDNLSGIESWRGEIDGRWALFELDGKTATLSFEIDPQRFPGTNHDVKLTVTDACGNTETFTTNF